MYAAHPSPFVSMLIFIPSTRPSITTPVPHTKSHRITHAITQGNEPPASTQKGQDTTNN